MQLCVNRGRITRRDIDLYNWKEKYHQRKPKRYESIDDWLDVEWNELVQSIEVGGIIYNKQEFERLKKLRNDKIYNIDESEMPFQSKLNFEQNFLR